MYSNRLVKVLSQWDVVKYIRERLSFTDQMLDLTIDKFGLVNKELFSLPRTAPTIEVNTYHSIINER